MRESLADESPQVHAVSIEDQALPIVEAGCLKGLCEQSSIGAMIRRQIDKIEQYYLDLSKPLDFRMSVNNATRVAVSL